MRTRLWSGLLAVLALVLPAVARQDSELVKVELRVTATVRPGRIQIDRGASDGVAVGDRVQLFPRQGGPWWGSVASVADRSAEVDLADPGVSVESGTRGEVLVPKNRLAPVEPAPAPVEPTPPAGAPEGEGEAPVFHNADPGYEPGMPLLAQVGPVKPEERESRILGRMYFAGDGMLTTDQRGDSYLRLGTDLVLDNPFGRGGEVHLDGELLYRATSGPDTDSNDGTDVRLDRASYAWGGTRFDSTRWEVGRFLQYGMPEFGLLDGVEYRQRTQGGDNWGVTFGFQPAANPDQQSGDDLEVSGDYEWLVDDAGRLRFQAGFQKTMHDGELDRDLLVTKVLYLPPDGWDLHGTAWVDFYGSADDAKDAFAEVTQAWLSTARRWEAGDSLQFSYRHLAFPELLRQEFEPVTFDQLAGDHYDRVAVNGTVGLAQNTWLRSIAGLWLDEDDAGGDAEVGFELQDALIERGRARLSAFGTVGSYSWVAGVRAALGQSGPSGWWEVFYEVANHHEEGFSNNIDDILQHRFGARQSLATIDGWSLSVEATGTVWEDDAGVQASVFAQRSF